jgi:steroid 5-alpha reductase family enzyme
MDAALHTAILGFASVAGFCWLLGVITREHSWVDRLWSIVPGAYAAWFAWQTGFGETRLVVMTALSVAWCARLTFNFARKGGYAKGGEDYRWEVLRGRMARWQWEVFAFVFIAGIQHALLLAISLPAWVALRGTSVPFGALDAIATAIFAVALVGETIADQQQWNFHQAKKAAAARGEVLDPPFCTTGLFRFSRHPNFFCEVTIWWAFYLFSVAATGEWLNVSIIGPIALTALFHGSTNFTESISVSKYPRYAEYQRTTSRLIPWPGGGLGPQR